MNVIKQDHSVPRPNSPNCSLLQKQHATADKPGRLHTHCFAAGTVTPGLGTWAAPVQHVKHMCRTVPPRTSWNRPWSVRDAPRPYEGDEGVLSSARVWLVTARRAD